MALAEAGADVAVHYFRNAQAAEAVADGITKAGRRAAVVQADVRVMDEVKAMADKAIEALGGIDILVNNAGLTRDNLAAFMSDEEWCDVLDTNLKGSFHCIKALSRPMARARWGRIINVSSDAGLLGDVMRANYSASKSGLNGLTKAMARELSASGITVNAVAPGYIETEMTADMKPAKKEKGLAGIPMGRFGRPEEVASVIVFLASDAAAYITGQVLSIDGGMQTRY
jgi:3-oxoacyl-[acyl-carrier protein] reductase